MLESEDVYGASRSHPEVASAITAMAKMHSLQGDLTTVSTAQPTGTKLYVGPIFRLKQRSAVLVHVFFTPDIVSPVTLIVVLFSLSSGC